VDAYITERRLKAVRTLPLPIPAAVLLEMTDEDLATIRAYIAEHGLPPSGFFARLLWRLRGKS
jgi:hypothetical protein